MIADGNLGIDTVRLGGLSRRVWTRDASEGWSTIGKDIPGRGHVILQYLRKLDSGATLNVMGGTDQERAYVEFSCCKALDQVHGATLDQARELARLRLAEASEFVELRETNVNRLDVARDFNMRPGELSGVLASLATVPIGGRKVQNLYRDSAAGNAQTLVIGNGSGRVRAYDKGDESGRPEAVNVLRVESQDRGKTLRKAGVKCWDRLTVDDVARVGRERFGWSGMGRLVAIQETNLDKILGSPELTDGQRLQAIAGLALATAGRWDSIGEKSRRTRVRRYLAMAGVGVEAATADGSPIIHDTDAQVIRLDFDRGVLRGKHAA